LGPPPGYLSQTDTPSSRVRTVPPEPSHSERVMVLGPLVALGSLGVDAVLAVEGSEAALAADALEPDDAADPDDAEEPALAPEVDAWAADSVVMAGAP